MAMVRQAEPPPRNTGGSRRGRYDWAAIVAELTASPGEWFLIDDTAGRGLPSAIMRRKMTALQDPAWDFQVTTRNNNRETRTAEVWMSAVPREEA